jgi:hypothetical protein
LPDSPNAPYQEEYRDIVIELPASIVSDKTAELIAHQLVEHIEVLLRVHHGGRRFCCEHTHLLKHYMKFDLYKPGR